MYLAKMMKQINLLQTTHCDLFFADAVILVEGSAENMLVPHFIRNKYPKLYQRYISILSINGRHSHRLNPLIEKLCIPTLVIADIDSAEATGHHKAIFPERGKGEISSNYTITQWLLKEKNLDNLLKRKSYYEKRLINILFELHIKHQLLLIMEGTIKRRLRVHLKIALFTQIINFLKNYQ